MSIGNRKTCGPVIWRSIRIIGPRGETREELEDNLKDLLRDLTSSAIPQARKVAELEVA